MKVCSAAEQVPGAAGHYEVTAELTWPLTDTDT